jgi:hypothetical protein
MSRIATIFVTAAIAIAVTLGAARADLASVRSQLDGDLAVYAQLKAENIEGRYSSMISTHVQKLESMISAYLDLQSRWTSIADALGHREYVSAIDSEGQVFVAACKKAESEPWNSHMTEIANSAAKLQPLFAAIFNKTKDTDIVKHQTSDLNASTQTFTNANADFVNWWVNSFKNVADKHQVVGIIHKKVQDIAGPDYHQAIQRKNTIDQKLAQEQGQLTSLAATLGSLVGSSPDIVQKRAQVLSQINALSATMATDSVEADKEDKEVKGFVALYQQADLAPPA